MLLLKKKKKPEKMEIMNFAIAMCEFFLVPPESSTLSGWPACLEISAGAISSVIFGASAFTFISYKNVICLFVSGLSLPIVFGQKPYPNRDLAVVAFCSIFTFAWLLVKTTCRRNLLFCFFPLSMLIWSHIPITVNLDIFASIWSSQFSHFLLKSRKFQAGKININLMITIKFWSRNPQK